MSLTQSHEVCQQVEELLFSYFPHTPTQGQREACSTIVHFLYDDDPNAMLLLRGYAGTGKTTLVSALIKMAPQLRLRTILMAPTGRAAKVIANYSGQEAFTIHKKIFTTVTDSDGKRHTMRARNKYSHTLFIVDEASMINNSAEFGSQHGLLEELIDYVRDGQQCRMMLIGDSAQLPPVGCDESPALDAQHLASLAPLQVFECELNEVVRQQTASGILSNATQLRCQIDQIEAFDEVSLPLFNTNGFGDIVNLPNSDIVDTLYKEYSDKSLEEVAFICRSNKRANLYNQAIRNRVLYKEEELNAGDLVMVVKNNYYWLENDSNIGFIANGEIVELLRLRNHQEMYGFHFVDATVRFVDYPDEPTLDCKLLLETLHSESASLTAAEMQKLYDNVMEDYADIPNKAVRLQQLRQNPYYNALQVKLSYALTCHKTQGGQWNTVFVEKGYLTDEMLNREYLRWLYTALTRATEKVYLIGFDDKFFVPADM